MSSLYFQDRFSLQVEKSEINLIHLLKIWQQRYRQRRQLAQLEAFQLADIGISYAQAQTEADKPFWQA